MCQENKLFCIICGKELVKNQQKYCCKAHRKRVKRKIWKQKKTKERKVEIKKRKIRRKEHRKQLLEQRLEQDKNESKNVCPVCGSWDRDIKEEYEVEYNGLKGKCLNPICKAEWKIKIPEKRNSWWP